jgi:hypothetical protein
MPVVGAAAVNNKCCKCAHYQVKLDQEILSGYGFSVLSGKCREDDYERNSRGKRNNEYSPGYKAS